MVKSTKKLIVRSSAKGIKAKKPNARMGSLRAAVMGLEPAYWNPASPFRPSIMHEGTHAVSTVAALLRVPSRMVFFLPYAGRFQHNMPEIRLPVPRG